MNKQVSDDSSEIHGRVDTLEKSPQENNLGSSSRMNDESVNPKRVPMASGSKNDSLTEGLRLHPMSWLFIVIEFVKSFFIPILIAIFAGGGDNFEFIGTFFVIPAVGFAIIQYWVYRYSLEENEIVIKEGVFVKNVRHVKYERIQNLNLSRNPLHRILGVAQLELESASGGKAEAVMRVISLSAVEQIRAKILSAKAAAESSNDDKESISQNDQTSGFFDEKGSVEESSSFIKDNSQQKELLQLPLIELVKAGLISNKGMVVVAFAFGILGQTRTLDKFFERLEDYINPWFDSVDIDFSHPLGIFAGILFGVIAFVIFIRTLSIIFMVVTYYGFKLINHSDKLAASYGLITQIHATVPQQRIQLISMSENILHRYFERAAIRVATAGGNANSSQGEQKKVFRWVAPIIERSKVDEFCMQLQPSIDYEVKQWQPVAQRAWRRLTRIYCLVLLLVSVPLAFQFHWWTFSLAALVPLIILYSKKTVANMRYGWTSNALIYESGWLIKHRTIVPLTKIQSVEFNQGFFDRRNNMANVAVDVAGLDLGRHLVSVRFLDTHIAQKLIDDLYDRVSHTQYTWK
ncbi:MAG: PH domain-containing protein [Gammaproteobacteria bacterium]|nr:PH domain-containing protein [Gammaproteobacteria bacterium]